MIRYIPVFAILMACVLADKHSSYSFSPSVGSGGGSSYSITGEDRITAVRVWELYSNYIYGFQICYGSNWSAVVGYISGTPLELKLFEDEKIIQISGTYTYYIQSVCFVTSRGRFLQAGQPAGNSFNMYPVHRDAELRFLSGQHNGPPTSMQAHWAVLNYNSIEGEH